MKHANVNGANVGAQFIAPKTANGTPAHLSLNELLSCTKVSKAQIAREVGCTRPTLSGLARRGIWPAFDDERARLRADLLAWLKKHGIDEKSAEAALDGVRYEASDGASRAPKTLQWGVDSPPKQKNAQNADFGRPVKTPVDWPSDAQKQTGRDESRPYDLSTVFDSPKEETEMLLKNETLSAQARQFFKIPRSPFCDDINCQDDVFTSADTAYARNALLDCAANQGFVALIGESGSGKTTMREELESRLAEHHRPVVVIKPYTLEMEPTERYGRVMKSGQISEAIIATLAPGARIYRSMQARARQVHELLTASQQAGNANLIIIEEAHRLPVATLRHLKGFMEMKNGLRRLLGVVLIGQPELHALLNEHRADVREIVQRCAKIEMLPLDAELENYIRHKFARVGVDAAQMFSQPIYDAIRARLVYVPRGGQKHEVRSVCYPLIVNNLITRAMNAAARVGMALSPDVIKEC